MTDANAVADIQAEFALTNASIPHHGSVSFFSSLPAWSGSTPDGTLGAATSYATKIALSAVVPAIASVLVLLACFVLLIVRYSCMRNVQDQKLVDRRQSGPPASLAHLILSTVLVHLFCVFLAVGFIGAIVVAESALNVSSSLSALVEDVRRTGLSLMDFVQWVRSRFVTFQPETLQDGTEAGRFLVTAFKMLVEYVPDRFPDVTAVRSALAGLLGDILNLIQVLADYVVWAFTAMIGINLLTCLALIFTFAHGAFTRRRTCCSITTLVAFLFVPLLFSWLYFSLWTGAGIGLADGCRMMGEYREFLSAGTMTNKTANLLIDSGLICPSKVEAAKLEARMVSAADAILENPLASDTMTLLLSINRTDLDDSATWAVDGIKEYVNCNILVRFSGRLESLVCGDRPTSLIAGMKYLWVSSLLLSVASTAIFIATVLGSPVMWTAAVWALPAMDATFLEGVGPSDAEHFGEKPRGEGDEEAGGGVADEVVAAADQRVGAVAAD
jgi:hypothetical protein